MRSGSKCAVTEALEATATMNDLPSDVMKTIFSYVGKGSYCFIGPVSKDFCYDYLTMDIIEDKYEHKLDFVLALERNKVTTVDAASSSLELAEHCILAAPDEFQEELFRIAARKGRQDIVTMAAQISDVDINAWIGDDDVEEITRKGDLSMLVLLEEEGLNMLSSLRLLCITQFAAFHGHLDILRWLHQTKEKVSPKLLFGCAARGGHLNIIQWGISAGYNFDGSSYINSVVSTGNLELVKWFRNEQNTSWRNLTNMYAAESGNIELLQYLHDNGCMFGFEAYDHHAACVDEKGKALEIYKWLRQHNVPWNEQACVGAARRGNLDALIYARDHGCPWDVWTIAVAVENAYFDIVKYCLESDCPIGDIDLCSASMTISDHEKALKILKLLRKFSIPWNEKTCEEAARSGNLEALKWARNEDCPWDESIFLEAIKSNNIAIVQYCIDNGCPFGQTAYPAAVRSIDPIPMLKLLHVNGYEWDKSACIQAASEGKLKVLRWLRYHNCPWDEEVCNSAVLNNHYEMLVYAHENECPWTKETYAFCFSIEGLDVGYEKIPTEQVCSDEILEYLQKHNCPQPRPNDWRIIVPSDSDPEDEFLM